MKYLFSGLLVLLLLAGGAGAWFIMNLTEELEEAKNSILDSIDNTDIALHVVIASRNEAIYSSINETSTKIDEESKLNTTKLDSIVSKMNYANNQIDALTTRHTAIENTLETTIFKTQEIYEQVHESVVMISDGEDMNGSGFISSYSSVTGTIEKIIITAYHVVEDLDDIYVSLYDGRAWKAEIRTFSSECDTAILNLIATENNPLPEMSSLPAVSLADSGKVRTGDQLIVIGSPFDEGLKGSATMGIVSHMTRSITIDEKLVANLIQLDAAANYGNSGGPVFDINGEVIGVVIARINPEIADGINWAVASNQIRKVLEAVPAEASSPYEYPYPWTGITVEDIKPTDIAGNERDVFRGAKVTKVDGPGITAGINLGDIITGIDNYPITNTDDFYSVIAEFYSAGDTVIIELNHAGVASMVSLTLKVEE